MGDLKNATEPTLESDDDIRKSRAKKIRKRIFTMIFILLNVVIIAGTAYVDFTQEGIPSAPYGINMIFLIAAAGCFAVALTSETSKYYYMLYKFNGKASVRLAFEVAALGKYYDCITPTGAGGQPYQVYYLKKRNVSAGASAAMPITGFLSLQFSFIILAIIVFAFGAPFLSQVADYTLAIRISAYVGILIYASPPLLIIFFAVFPKAAGVVLRFFITLFAKLRIVKRPDELIEKSHETYGEYRRSIVAICKEKQMFFIVLGLGLVYQIAICSMPFFVLKSFGSPLMFRSVFAMMVMIYCAITYIPTPGNSGAAEVSFYALLASLHQSHLFWAMIIWRFFSYYLFLVIGWGIFTFRAIEKRMDKRRI